MKNKKYSSRKVFDVVCGMELDIQNVRLSFEHEGIEYYFCSDNCKDHFVDDPGKYVGKD